MPYISNEFICSRLRDKVLEAVNGAVVHRYGILTKSLMDTAITLAVAVTGQRGHRCAMFMFHIWKQSGRLNIGKHALLKR